MTLRMAICMAVACLPAIVSAQVPVPPGPPPVPPARSCLHGDTETAADAARRVEALAAMRMIGYVLDDFAPRPVVAPHGRRDTA